MAYSLIGLQLYILCCPCRASEQAGFRIPSGDFTEEWVGVAGFGVGFRV